MSRPNLRPVLRTLTDPAFWRMILPLALPITLQNLLTSSFQIVDTLMVGQLGDTVIASVGIAGQIAFFINILFYGITAGGSVFIAQFWGARDRRSIRQIYGLMLALTLPVCAVFILACSFAAPGLIGLFTNEPQLIETGAKYLRIACWSYLGVGLNQAFAVLLRSTEEVKLPMCTGIVSVLLNALANYVLIFGRLGFPALGVEGAAIATVVSAAAGPVLLLGISLWRGNMLRAPLREMFSFDAAFAGRYFRRALPVLLNESLWSMGVLGYNAVFGRMGADNYAALTIFRTIENLGFVFFIGLCSACAVLVGKRVGEGRIDDAKRVSAAFLVFEPVLGLCVGILIFLFAGAILSLFNSEPYVHRTAQILLYIYAADIVLRNIPYITVCGIFRAGGDTKTGVKYDSLCLYGIALPLVILTGLVLHWPFLIVYILMLVAEDLPKSWLCLRRYLSYKWIQPVAGQPVPLSETEVEGR